MKIKSLFIFALTLIDVYSFSQNLVVNPSFENTSTNCSQTEFFIDLSATWDAANSNIGGDSCTSPDLYSECNNWGIPIGLPHPSHVPNSTLGFQYAHSGSRYAGIVPYTAHNEYREYIQGRLNIPLEQGQLYSVSMYISRAEESGLGSNNLGIYFSNTHYERDACPGETNSGIYLTPQLNYAQVISDTSEDWFLLEWDYMATGGEQYFIIGNFFNTAATDIDTISTSGPYQGMAYYFIDDVSVAPVNCSASYLLTPDPDTEHNWFAVSQVTGTPPFHYQWNWGDGNTSTGAVVSHTYDSAGYYNICLTVIDGNGCSNIYCDASTHIYKTEQTMVTVNCVLQLPTSIEEQAISSSNAYPNPANETLTIEINLAHPKKIEIALLNVTGRVVWNLASEQKITETKCSIPVSTFAEGIYFVKASADSEQQYIKVIIK